MRSFVGTGALVGLALRRDRVRLLIWIVAIAGVVAMFVGAIGELYPDEASRRQLGASVGANPAFGALLGPLLDPLSVGGLLAWRMSFLPMVLVPLMALQTISRHTRAEEESGRLELVGSTAIGHRAPLTAALVVTFATCAVIGGLVAVSLAAQGEALAGSIALGAVYAGSGAMFAAVAAVTAQLSETARGASGLAGSVLGVSFLVRAIADGTGASGPTWLRWLSPAGWTIQMRPFADERWWVLGLMAVLIVGFVAVAYAVVERRDIGAGLLPTRLGPAEAPPVLASPLALAWRLHRPTLAWWTLGIFVVGMVYGSVADNVSDLIDDVPGAGDFLERLGGAGALVDAFFVATMGILALIVTIYTISALLRTRAEETSGRVEPVLATRVTRLRWLASHVTIALGGTAWLMVVGGASEGLVHGLRAGDLGFVPRLAGASLVQLPAVFVVAGVAVALFGLLPRFVGVTWGALVAFLLLGQLGPVLQVDQWALNTSPFTHTPRVPGGDVTVVPLVILLGVAAALLAAGSAGFRRRDLH